MLISRVRPGARAQLAAREHRPRAPRGAGGTQNDADSRHKSGPASRQNPLMSLESSWCLVAPLLPDRPPPEGGEPARPPRFPGVSLLPSVGGEAPRSQDSVLMASSSPGWGGRDGLPGAGVAERLVLTQTRDIEQMQPRAGCYSVCSQPRGTRGTPHVPRGHMGLHSGAERRRGWGGGPAGQGVGCSLPTGGRAWLVRVAPRAGGNPSPPSGPRGAWSPGSVGRLGSGLSTEQSGWGTGWQAVPSPVFTGRRGNT